MENQRRKIEEERIESQKESDEANKVASKALMMTKGTALKLVADMAADGSAKSYICIVCNSTFIICLGGNDCKEPKTCPSCNAPLIQRFR